MCVITRHASCTQTGCQDFSSRKGFHGEGLGVDKGLQMVGNSSLSLSLSKSIRVLMVVIRLLWDPDSTQLLLTLQYTKHTLNYLDHYL